MKYLLIFLSTILAFAALALLRIFLDTFRGWIEGPRTNIILPGLGLIISTPFLLILLLIVEIVLVSILIFFVWLILRQ